MLAKLVGYNEVEYDKDGADRSFVVVYVKTDKEITSGSEYISCVLSNRYWNEKIQPAFSSGKAVHTGFDKKKHNKPFLYVKE